MWCLLVLKPNFGAIQTFVFFLVVVLHFGEGLKFEDFFSDGINATWERIPDTEDRRPPKAFQVFAEKFAISTATNTSFENSTLKQDLQGTSLPDLSNGSRQGKAMPVPTVASRFNATDKRKQSRKKGQADRISAASWVHESKVRPDPGSVWQWSPETNEKPFHTQIATFTDVSEIESQVTKGKVVALGQTQGQVGQNAEGSQRYHHLQSPLGHHHHHHDHDHDHHESHEDLQQSRPYHFSYTVKNKYGNNFQQRERSDGEKITGEYKVLLPDGRYQTVNYVADYKSGYNAAVTYKGKSKHPHHLKGHHGNGPSQGPWLPSYQAGPGTGTGYYSRISSAPHSEGWPRPTQAKPVGLRPTPTIYFENEVRQTPYSYKAIPTVPSLRYTTIPSYSSGGGESSSDYGEVGYRPKSSKLKGRPGGGDKSYGYYQRFNGNPRSPDGFSGYSPEANFGVGQNYRSHDEIIPSVGYELQQVSSSHVPPTQTYDFSPSSIPTQYPSYSPPSQEAKTYGMSETSGYGSPSPSPQSFVMVDSGHFHPSMYGYPTTTSSSGYSTPPASHPTMSYGLLSKYTKTSQMPPTYGLPPHQTAPKYWSGSPKYGGSKGKYRSQKSKYRPPTTQPSYMYGSPMTSGYGPPPTQASSYGPPTQSTSYGPPPTQTTSYGPPPTQSMRYGTPPTQSTSYGPPPTQATSYGPPSTQTTSYGLPPTQSTSYRLPTTQTTSYSPPSTQASMYMQPPPLSTTYSRPTMETSHYKPTIAPILYGSTIEHVPAPLPTAGNHDYESPMVYEHPSPRRPSYTTSKMQAPMVVSSLNPTLEYRMQPPLTTGMSAHAAYESQSAPGSEPGTVIVQHHHHEFVEHEPAAEHVARNHQPQTHATPTIYNGIPPVHVLHSFEVLHPSMDTSHTSRTGGTEHQPGVHQVKQIFANQIVPSSLTHLDDDHLRHYHHVTNDFFEDADTQATVETSSAPVALRIPIVKGRRKIGNVNNHGVPTTQASKKVALGVSSMTQRPQAGRRVGTSGRNSSKGFVPSPTDPYASEKASNDSASSTFFFFASEKKDQNDLKYSSSEPAGAVESAKPRRKQLKPPIQNRDFTGASDSDEDDKIHSSEYYQKFLDMQLNRTTPAESKWFPVHGSAKDGKEVRIPGRSSKIPG